MGSVQARPLFDYLPPVIINENQQITSNNNSHTTIFYPVGKYATDVHYQIICIPIFLQPVEDGLKRCGEVQHHMINAIKGKATEAPIKDIIKFHNDTLHRVNFNYNNMLKNLPEAPFTPYGQGRNTFWIFCLELWERHLVFLTALNWPKSTQPLPRTSTGQI